MKDSLIITSFFILGLVLGIYKFLPQVLIQNSFSTYALYLLLFFVGISMGSDKKTWFFFFSKSLKLVLIPVSIVIGSLGGAAGVSFFLKGITIKEALAVGAGFGYYSLSSIIIAELHSEALGMTALLSNISREIMTLVLTPFFVRFFGPLSSVASGGATAMDTTLPVIARFSGKEIAAAAVFSGFILTLITPFAVTFILNF
ncbi:MAG: lysine exporter LysO family protein [Desulfobacteraceae bacterium]|nr:lysine exporter LysO family protein [Desulfobacteraceae bacterium]